MCQHLNYTYCNSFVSRTELWTNGQADNLSTCPQWIFQARDILHNMNVVMQKVPFRYLCSKFLFFYFSKCTLSSYLFVKQAFCKYCWSNTCSLPRGPFLFDGAHIQCSKYSYGLLSIRRESQCVILSTCDLYTYSASDVRASVWYCPHVTCTLTQHQTWEPVCDTVHMWPVHRV